MATDAAERRDALVERLFSSTIGAFDLAGVYVGERLGLYRALAEQGALTAGELADATGMDERYALEWLEHQAASSILDADESGGTWRFRLPEGHDEALLDETSLNYVTPFSRLLVACLRPIDSLLAAYKTGEGDAYGDYGADLHEGQAAFTRPMFLTLLAQEWLPGVPEIHERLVADPPARVADVACGCGWSSIGMAQGYSKIQVDGIDLDDPSIELARRHLAATSLGDRVTFHAQDAADSGLGGRFDLVTMFESLHDLSYPVQVLQACRGLLADGGVVLVGDELTGETFDPEAGDLERLYYGFSILHCLPVGMVGEGAAGTGTVMRADTVRRFAEEAGFSSIEIAPIENDFWRFYLLRP